MNFTKTFALLLILALFSTWAVAQPDRKVSVVPKNDDTEKSGRVALVIGNGKYKSSPLKNPPNDARSIAAVLRACGFEVIEKINADLRTMESAVRDFGKQIQGKDCALFFYAGHGLQVKGQNYLVPVDANVDQENLVKYDCMNAGLALARMENAGCRVNIVILDACRNNPFARSWRAANDGLAQMDAARGSLIAYATAPGSVAADGAGSNSYYTASLLKHIRTPGMKVEEVFKRVRSEVLRSTENQQVPWENSSLVGDFYFIPKDGQLVQPSATPLPFAVATPIPTPRPSVPSTGKSEVSAWEALGKLEGMASNQPIERQVAMYESYVKEWNGTAAGNDASKQLGRLRTEKSKADALAELLAKAKVEYGRLSRQESQDVTSESQARSRAQEWSAYVSTYKGANYQLAEAQKKASYYEKWTAGPKHGDVENFDLGGGVSLEMVYIEGGSFEMGSPSSEKDRQDDEGPVHTVELDGFWMGKYEVTQEQYQAIMGSNPSYFKGSKNPVEEVSWNDAKSFCEKLSRKTDQPFRLPTEAEWEYACRAGSRTRYSFGDSDSQLGDYAWYDGNSGSKTHPVGQKRPNDWGLYDMHGNVWEWCADWCGYYSSGRQKNPTGKSSGSYRVYRGGCWGNYARSCRSAYRRWNFPTVTSYYLGFRVVASPHSL